MVQQPKDDMCTSQISTYLHGETHPLQWWSNGPFLLFVSPFFPPPYTHTHTHTPTEDFKKLFGIKVSLSVGKYYDRNKTEIRQRNKLGVLGETLWEECWKDFWPCTLVGGLEAGSQNKPDLLDMWTSFFSPNFSVEKGHGNHFKIYTILRMTSDLL